MEQKEFYISHLSTIDDTNFILEITNTEGITRMYEVSVRCNKFGDLVGLKSEKKS